MLREPRSTIDLLRARREWSWTLIGFTIVINARPIHRRIGPSSRKRLHGKSGTPHPLTGASVTDRQARRRDPRSPVCGAIPGHDRTTPESRLAIPLHCDRPIRLRLRVPPSPVPHVLPVVVTVVERPDRLGEPERIPRRNDDTASDRAHELSRFAHGLCGGDHRTPGGEDAVEAARDDVARKAPCQSHYVDVCCCKRCDSNSRGWNSRNCTLSASSVPASSTSSA